MEPAGFTPLEYGLDGVRQEAAGIPHLSCCLIPGAKRYENQKLNLFCVLQFLDIDCFEFLRAFHNGWLLELLSVPLFFDEFGVVALPLEDFEVLLNLVRFVYKYS